MHDRRVKEGGWLWEQMAGQPASDGDELEASAKKKNQRAGGKRKAKVEVRHMKVSMEPPEKDPRLCKSEPVEAWVVQVVEPEAPEGCEQVEWMLLILTCYRNCVSNPVPRGDSSDEFLVGGELRDASGEARIHFLHRVVNAFGKKPFPQTPPNGFARI
jgi:hypothetical protein